MTDLLKLMENPTTTVIIMFSLILFLMKLDDIKKWIDGKLKDYHKRKAHDEVVDEMVEGRDQETEQMSTLNDMLMTISAASEQHAAALQTMATSLDGINHRLDDAERERKQDIIVNGRASLQHLYEVLRDKETLTINEYETFDALSARYLSAGGNGAFKNKIIPEIQKKPVSEEGK